MPQIRCKRGFEPPSIATLIGQTSERYDLPQRVAAVDQLRERVDEMTRVQKVTYEMSLAEVIQAVRATGTVRARGQVFSVDKGGQLVSSLPV
jgi:hypothetical protein